MKRIVVIGPGGAGKSVFAQALGKHTQLPAIHLDSLFWKPNWQKSTPTEWQATLEKISQDPEWIIEGNYKRTIDTLYEASDTIIFLDYPRWLCMWQAIRRRFEYHGKLRKDLGNNQERLHWLYIWRIINYPRRDVLKRIELLHKQDTLTILRSPRHAAAYLANLTTK
jgi:adenylate kinase family enzyme